MFIASAPVLPIKFDKTSNLFELVNIENVSDMAH